MGEGGGRSLCFCWLCVSPFELACFSFFCCFLFVMYVMVCSRENETRLSEKKREAQKCDYYITLQYLSRISGNSRSAGSTTYLIDRATHRSHLDWLIGTTRRNWWWRLRRAFLIRDVTTVPPQKSPRTPLFTPKPVLFINFSHTTQLTEFCVINILTVFLYTISYSLFEFLKYMRELLR